jgi:tRNA G18 (ribose-2'-O)-methylase SpoU
MGPLLFFRSATDEKAAALRPGAIEMIYAGDQVVNIITNGTNKQKIVLGCADGESENVLKVLATALAPMAKFHQKLVVVADDAADEYLVAGITTVTVTEDEV